MQEEYKNFKGISIFGDLPIKFDMESSIDILIQNRIGTLQKLFISYDAGVFDVKASKDLLGTIELLRAEYLNVPLIAENYLDEYIEGKKKCNLSRTDLHRLSRLGLTTSEVNVINKFYLYYFENINIQCPSLKLVDLFNLFIKDGLFQIEMKRNESAIVLQNLNHKLSFLVSYYTNKMISKNLPVLENDEDTLLRLNNQLQILIEHRDNVDRQIEIINHQINCLNQGLVRKRKNESIN